MGLLREVFWLYGELFVVTLFQREDMILFLNGIFGGFNERFFVNSEFHTYL